MSDDPFGSGGGNEYDPFGDDGANVDNGHTTEASHTEHKPHTFVNDGPKSPPPAEENVDDFALIREWNAKRREVLNQKETNESAKRGANRDAARKELAAFYDEKTKTRISKLKTNRQLEKAAVDDRDKGANYANPFERVVKLVDLAVEPEGKDKSRLKSVLIQLKAKSLAETRKD